LSSASRDNYLYLVVGQARRLVANVSENNDLTIQRFVVFNILPPMAAEVVRGKHPKWVFSTREQPLKHTQ
jgi:hypothetical protein